MKNLDYESPVCKAILVKTQEVLCSSTKNNGWEDYEEEDI